MKKLAALAALPLALAACSTSTHSSPSKTVTVSATPATTNAASPSTSSTDTSSVAQDDGAAAPSSDSTDADSSDSTAGAPLSFGQTYTSKTGRKVTVSKPVPYNPSDTAATEEAFPAGTPYRKVKITLDNTSKESFDASEISLNVTSGETSVSSAVDSAQGIGDSPSGTLLPGHKLTWTEAYPVPAGKNLTIEVTSLAGTVAIWDGPAS